MNSRMLRGGLLAAAFLILAGAPGSAAPAATISALSATTTTSAVAVAGKAAFAGDAVTVGTDAAGDSTQKQVGADITGATIQLADNGRDLVFTFQLGDALPNPAGASPSVVYNWPLAVNGNDTELFLSAGRAGTYGITPSGGDPVFALLQNSADGFLTVAQLTGKIADGVVQWTVPVSQLGASAGSTISQGGTVATGSTLGVEGVVYFNANLGGDAITLNDFTVPGLVTLGIAPAGTPEESITLTTPATTKANGSFTGTMPLPTTAGTYTLLAKACTDDTLTVCTTRSTTFTR